MYKRARQNADFGQFCIDKGVSDIYAGEPYYCLIWEAWTCPQKLLKSLYTKILHNILL